MTYGLTSTLSTAAEALNADSGAIAITSNNVANVNTPGYSRQLVNLSASALNSNGVSQNNGVSLGGFTSVRNEVLQLAINGKISDMGSLTAQSSGWERIEASFSGTDTGLGAAISNLFSDLSALSASPTDAGVRQTAYAAASQLTDAFHQSASSLSSASSGLNQTISGAVEQINQLSSQIAGLDQQLAGLQTSGQKGGTLEDQRDELTTQLAQLTGLTSVNTESTPSLALSNGTPLVIGGTAYPLRAVQGLDSTTHIIDNAGNDITSGISGGSLGGSLLMRDKEIPAVQQSLDQLATQLATAINTAQAKGYDANGSQGSDFFTIPPSGTNAASSISLNLTTPAGIAISSDGSAGSSGNLANLLKVQSDPLPSGLTPTGAYAGLVEAIGSSASGVAAQARATTASLNQLTAQQSSESGVSVDEETTNLLRYQQAYSAAAQVINTINSLFSIVLNMGTVTG